MQIHSLLLLLIVEYTGVLLAVIADLVSGIRKAKSRGEKCTSWGLRRTVDKLSRYYLVLVALSLVDAMTIAAVLFLRDIALDFCFPAFPFLTTFGSLSLALIEAKSICERAETKGDMHHTARMLSDLLSRFHRV